MFIKYNKSTSEENSESDTDTTLGMSTNGSGTEPDADEQQVLRDLSTVMAGSLEEPSESELSDAQLSLVHDERCQQCRCVRTVMLLLKLEFDVETADTYSNQYEQLFEVNPRSKVPVLKEGSTFSLAERWGCLLVLILTFELRLCRIPPFFCPLYFGSKTSCLAKR